MSGSQNSLSPFSTASRQLRPQQPFVDGMSPTTSAGYLQHQHQQQQQQQQHRPVTLEDIEANIQRQQAASRYQVNNEPPMSNGKTISLAELEAALGARPQHQQQQQQPEHGLPPFGFNQPDPMQLLAMKQQQELKEKELMSRELKQREQSRKVSYKATGKFSGVNSSYVSLNMMVL